MSVDWLGQPSENTLPIAALLLSGLAAWFLSRAHFGLATTLEDLDRTEQFWSGSQKAERRFRTQVDTTAGIALLCLGIGLQIASLGLPNLRPPWLAGVVMVAIAWAIAEAATSRLVMTKHSALVAERERS